MQKVKFQISPASSWDAEPKAEVEKDLPPEKPPAQQARQHYNDGIVFEQRQKYDEALGEYYKALELDPGFAQAWMAIGNVQQMRDHFLQAERAYKTAIAADASLATAKNNLAWLYYANRMNLEEAETLARDAVQNYEEEIVRTQKKERLPAGISMESRIRSLRLGMAGCYDTLGWIHQAKASYDRAAEMWYLALSQTAETEPELRAKFHYQLGMVLAQKRELPAARESLARARSLSKDPQLLAKVAAIEGKLPGGAGEPR
ncbi:MAG: tetratricopeptide repeat protein [Planctomycetes bacterium]|nr:tetratricopeptide repeat protein [Planctomycetota bacterium]